MSPSSTENKEIGFHKQFAVDVNGIHTEFVFHKFANNWLLLITQLGKIPGIYKVTFDVKRDERVIPTVHGPIDHPEYHVSVPVTMNCCLGSDTDEIRSGIQFLVNKTTLNTCPTEFVMGLGLKKIDGVNLRGIAKVLEEMIFS